MKKRYLVIGVVSVIVLAVTTVGIWSYPLWQTAFLLNNMIKSKALEAQIHLELEEEELSENVRQFLKVISWALGTEEGESLDWYARGQINGNQGYARIYCGAWEEPVTEVYVSKESTLVNMEMLYGIVQGKFREEHPLMGTFLPDWGYGSYITLEQIQEIFQVDFRQFFQKNDVQEHNLWEILLLLNHMERKKTENGNWQFQTIWNDYQIAFEAGNENQTPRCSIDGVNKAEEQKIKRFTGVLTKGKETPIIFPSTLMKQEEIEPFRKLWSAFLTIMEGRN
ncbi:MAG: hypothetical protein HFI74_05955 [Lachnospiraceae bacterium]|nr:hypothetical protein [Lachnospiraceae bacterium]